MPSLSSPSMDNNMIIAKAADGRTFISFNYKPFDRKEKK
jgi:hypothetical protein